MFTTTRSTVCASVIALLAGLPAAALAVSTDGASVASGDGLGAYNEDLSAYGVPQPTGGGGNPAHATAAATEGAMPLLLEPAARHALFHDARLNTLDGLSAYGGDLSPFDSAP